MRLQNILSQMNADKSQERCSQSAQASCKGEYACVQHCDTTSMLSTLQRCAQSSHPTGGVGVDRRCRSITAPVKKEYPYLSRLLSALICDKSVVSVCEWKSLTAPIRERR
jgi:hypothetical protein